MQISYTNLFFSARVAKYTQWIENQMKDSDIPTVKPTLAPTVKADSADTVKPDSGGTVKPSTRRKVADGFLIGVCPRYDTEPIVDRNILFTKPAARDLVSDASNIEVAVGGNLVITSKSNIVIGKNLDSFTRGTPKAPAVEGRGFMNWKGGEADWNANHCANWDYYQCPGVGFTPVVNDVVTVTTPSSTASGSNLYINNKAGLVIESGASVVFGGPTGGRGPSRPRREGTRDIRMTPPGAVSPGKGTLGSVGGHSGAGGYSHSASQVVNDKNVRPDGQIGSHFNQITRHPTTSPTVGFSPHHKNIEIDGKVESPLEIEYNSKPTSSPTAFPTKSGDTCTFQSGAFTFSKHVGWRGAGPRSAYCALWSCEKAQGGVFKKQARVCSIDRHTKGKFCSHIKCGYHVSKTSGKSELVSVKHDHREKHGGNHIW